MLRPLCAAFIAFNTSTSVYLGITNRGIKLQLFTSKIGCVMRCVSLIECWVDNAEK